RRPSMMQSGSGARVSRSAGRVPRRCSGCGGRRNEEERDAEDQVERQEEDALEPVGASVHHEHDHREHGEHDGDHLKRREDEIEVDRLGEPERDQQGAREHEHGGHEERDLETALIGDGHRGLHVVGVRQLDRGGVLGGVAGGVCAAASAARAGRMTPTNTGLQPKLVATAAAEPTSSSPTTAIPAAARRSRRMLRRTVCRGALDGLPRGLVQKRWLWVRRVKRSPKAYTTSNTTPVHSETPHSCWASWMSWRRPALKWKLAGQSMAATAMESSPAFASAACRLKVCSLRRQPPTTMAPPATRSRFPRIEPVTDAFTTAFSPLVSAMTARISSAALPNVAFNRPPHVGPRRTARLSVASPISSARGITPTAASANVAAGSHGAPCPR